ncbi:MAG: hypothetical protein Q7S35_04220 [Candidatus Limnocylindrales bacterium]|nr:hypothetical protein [Candidatus Limnocylindrales bacterium]
MDLAIPLFLSGSGVAVAALAFFNRDKPEWQRDMRRIYIIALGQVALGAVAWVVLSLASN